MLCVCRLSILHIAKMWSRFDARSPQAWIVDRQRCGCCFMGLSRQANAVVDTTSNEHEVCSPGLVKLFAGFVPLLSRRSSATKSPRRREETRHEHLAPRKSDGTTAVKISTPLDFVRDIFLLIVDLWGAEASNRNYTCATNDQFAWSRVTYAS